MADIMIIDDNAELQEILKSSLESDCHEVVSAMDGASAREMLPNIKPDIVLLDVGCRIHQAWNSCHISRTSILIHVSSVPAGHRDTARSPFVQQ